MKIVRSLLLLFIIAIYTLFNQFVVKAFVSTDRESNGQENFCMDKKLDTYDSKRGCWKKNTICSLVEDCFLGEKISHKIAYGENEIRWSCGSYCLTLAGNLTHPPPNLEYYSERGRLKKSRMGSVVLVV